MQITLKEVTHYTYTESPQTNPIRYVAMHQIGENEYVNSTNPFKCKDYFNDFVAHKHGHPRFEVYGMKSDSVVFDQYGGLYVLVYDTKPQFRGNLERVLEPFTRKWGARVTSCAVDAGCIQDAKNLILPSQRYTACMLWFSPECFVSTFRISALLLFIRNCNIDTEIDSYREACRLPRMILESQWYPNQFDIFIEEKIDFPQQQEYWYYQGLSYNSQKMPETTSSMIHNNGQHSWLSYLTPGKLNVYERLSAFHSSFGVDVEEDDDGEELEFDEDEEEANAL